MVDNYRFHDIPRALAGSQSGGDDTGYVIEFFHVPTGEKVSFKAFIKDYEDKYSSQWNSEETFGRMDPIQTFQRTTRIITLAWSVPSISEADAIENLVKAEAFLSMLYPVYEEQDMTPVGPSNPQRKEVSIDEWEQIVADKITNSAVTRTVSTMAAPPLFKLKLANLIASADNTSEDSALSAKSSAELGGLLGTISGLSYRPVLEEEFYGHNEFSTAQTKVPAGYLVPQTIEFSCDFTVLHTHKMGFRRRMSSASGELTNQSGFPHRGSVLKKLLR